MGGLASRARHLVYIRGSGGIYLFIYSNPYCIYRTVQSTGARVGCNSASVRPPAQSPLHLDIIHDSIKREECDERGSSSRGRQGKRVPEGRPSVSLLGARLRRERDACDGKCTWQFNTRGLALQCLSNVRVRQSDRRGSLSGGSLSGDQHDLLPLRPHEAGLPWREARQGAKHPLLRRGRSPPAIWVGVDHQRSWRGEAKGRSFPFS